jgi:hypothetical protein
MTIDMTNNHVPYGLLTDEEKAALEAHEKAGGEFSYIGGGGRRYLSKTWRINSIVRTVPLPEKTQDVIAWDRLPSYAVVVARDKDGEVHFYTDPDCYPEVAQWVMEGGLCRRIDDFPGIVQVGTCGWKDSKQRRPR